MEKLYEIAFAYFFSLDFVIIERLGCRAFAGR